MRGKLWIIPYLLLCAAIIAATWFLHNSILSSHRLQVLAEDRASQARPPLTTRRGRLPNGLVPRGARNRNQAASSREETGPRSPNWHNHHDRTSD
jgi:hypothetical protein